MESQRLAIYGYMFNWPNLHFDNRKNFHCEEGMSSVNDRLIVQLPNRVENLESIRTPKHSRRPHHCQSLLPPITNHHPPLVSPLIFPISFTWYYRKVGDYRCELEWAQGGLWGRDKWRYFDVLSLSKRGKLNPII